MTLEELRDQWLRSLESWLDAARAIPGNREFFKALTPGEFLIQTEYAGRESVFGPSIGPLRRARLAAEVLQVAEERGISDAILYKLARDI